MTKVIAVFTGEPENLDMFKTAGIKWSSRVETITDNMIKVTWVCEEQIITYSELFDYDIMDNWSVEFVSATETNIKG